MKTLREIKNEQPTLKKKSNLADRLEHLWTKESLIYSWKSICACLCKHFMMQAVSLLFPHEISDFATILCTESHKLTFQMYNFAVAMISLQNYYIYM